MFEEALKLIPINVQESIKGNIHNISQNEVESLHNMVHHVLCITISNNYVLDNDNSASYIVLEMLDRGSCLGLLKKYYYDEWNLEYIPDLIQIGIDENLTYKKYPLSSCLSHKVTVEPRDACIFDVTISKNPHGAFQSKLAVCPYVIPLVFCIQTGKMIYGEDYVYQESKMRCETFLESVLNSMTIEERNLFLTSASHELKSLPHLKFTDGFMSYNQPFEEEVPIIKTKRTEIPVNMPHINVDFSEEFAAYKGILPVFGLVGTGMITFEEKLDRFIELIENHQVYQHPRQRKTIFNPNYCLTEVKSGRFPIELKDLFNFGFRSKNSGIIGNLEATIAVKNPKKNPPWTDKMFLYLAERCPEPSFVLDSLAEYNKVDEMMNKVSDHFLDLLSKTAAGHFLSCIVSTEAALSSRITINRSGCIWFPILTEFKGVKEVTGFGIRGPSHMKTENSRVPIILMQLVPLDWLMTMFKEMSTLRKYWIFKLPESPGLVLTCHLTCNWPLKNFSGANGYSAILTPVNWLTDHNMGGFGDSAWTNIIESLNSKEDSIIYIFVMQVLFLHFQNPELDGFLSDFRKLCLPLARSLSGKNSKSYFLGDGTDLFEVLGGCKANPIVLYIISQYNLKNSI